MKIKFDAEMKKVLGRIKSARGQVEQIIKSREAWLEEARKYANRQRTEVKKLFGGDLAKVRAFIDRESKTLNALQKKLPGELQKARKFIALQRKDLQKMLKGMRKAKSSKKTTSRRAKSS